LTSEDPDWIVYLCNPSTMVAFENFFKVLTENPQIFILKYM